MGATTMISGFWVLNQKGEVLISRLFRPDARRSLADIFRINVIASPSQSPSPLITIGSTTFFHTRHNNLWLVSVTKNNANAPLVFDFMYKFISIARSYFGKVDEESIKNNFVLIYELLDEILDFGIPQNSESETLKMYITDEGVKSQVAVREEASKITIQATGAISWRRNDIKYRKNEAFVDVVESVNLSMSSSGTVLRADVDGKIMMRAYLSGMPECKFGLNDKLVIDKSSGRSKAASALAEASHSGAVELDDCQFHQCVKLDEFDSDRTISFVPPDGEFEMMRYRATSNVNLPFKVQPIVEEIGRSRSSMARPSTHLTRTPSSGRFSDCKEAQTRRSPRARPCLRRRTASRGRAHRSRSTFRCSCSPPRACSCASSRSLSAPTTTLSSGCAT